MLFHLAAALLQAFFSALQEAGFLNVGHNPWWLMCHYDADFS